MIGLIIIHTLLFKNIDLNIIIVNPKTVTCSHRLNTFFGPFVERSSPTPGSRRQLSGAIGQVEELVGEIEVTENLRTQFSLWLCV